MIAIPAIDLRGRCCLRRLTSVSPLDAADPCALAREFARFGFTRLHLVDLDAASRAGSNRRAISDVLRERCAATQVAVAGHDADAVADLFDAGASHAVVPAAGDTDSIAELATAFPGEIILASDARPGRISGAGWKTRPGPRLVDLAEDLADVPLGGIMLTISNRDARLERSDIGLIEELVELDTVPVLVAAEVDGVPQLRNLDDCGVFAVVLRDALYSGALNAWSVADEFQA